MASQIDRQPRDSLLSLMQLRRRAGNNAATGPSWPVIKKDLQSNPGDMAHSPMQYRRLNRPCSNTEITYETGSCGEPPPEYAFSPKDRESAESSATISTAAREAEGGTIALRTCAKQHARMGACDTAASWQQLRTHMKLTACWTNVPAWPSWPMIKNDLKLYAATMSTRRRSAGA